MQCYFFGVRQKKYSFQTKSLPVRNKLWMQSCFFCRIENISSRMKKTYLQEIPKVWCLFPEVESRTQGSRPRPRTEKKFEAKAKNRPSRGQGQGHRRWCSPKKKKGLQNFFSGEKGLQQFFFQAVST